MVRHMEVVPGVHWIEGINGNCYLIVNQTLTLIDTGLPRNAKKILRYITENLHRKPSDVTMIILTHSHFDHTGNAEQLRVVTGARIAAHQEDAVYIEGKQQALVPKGGMGMLFKVLSPLIKVRPFPVDTVLKDKDEIAGLSVIFTPGHTPGSISLYDAKRKVLFTGDTLRYVNGVLEGPSEKFSRDVALARASIKKLTALQFTTLLSGHGVPLTDNAAQRVRDFASNFP